MLYEVITSYCIVEKQASPIGEACFSAGLAESQGQSELGTVIGNHRLIPKETVFAKAAQLLGVLLVPIHIHKAVAFLIAIEPAQQVGERPGAIPQQLDAIVSSGSLKEYRPQEELIRVV